MKPGRLGKQRHPEYRLIGEMTGTAIVPAVVTAGAILMFG